MDLSSDTFEPSSMLERDFVISNKAILFVYETASIQVNVSFISDVRYVIDNRNTIWLIILSR